MKKVVNRIIAILPAIALQILVWVVLLTWFEWMIPIMVLFFWLSSGVFVLYILVQRSESTYKILWLIIILSSPILGAWLYCFFGNKKTVKKIIKKINSGKKDLQFKFNDNKEILEEIKRDNCRLSQTFRFISNNAGLPINYVDSVKYYDVGEKMFEDMKNELRKAVKFIFIEYFILENGIFWDSIIEILEEKVKEGVDVRVLYDDLGSIGTYSPKSMVELNVKGIKCMPFNPLIFIKATLNNRDHRKMMIIDNRVAFSGGINIADEYINEKMVYGHWKDIGFRITGEAVSSFTYMFADFWNGYSFEKIDETFFEAAENNHKDGYVLSYYDSPARKEELSYNLYIDLLYQANDYIWFYSPYLILGDSLSEALIKAAQRGIDVRIIIPGIPDKKFVYRIAKSYYKQLIENGVKIYEYTPGFVHAKACICDDIICTIGTVNLDYRSLFLHFENNSIFYKSAMIKDLKADIETTITKSHLVKREEVKNGFFRTIVDGILRIIAPLC